MYREQDRDSCVTLFDSHPSLVAAPAEREAFLRFLGSGPDTYFVMEHEEQIVGCGGYTIQPREKSARLQWGIVSSGLSKQGLGRFLLMFRLKEIGKSGDIHTVVAEVPREIEGFFAKQGFRTGDASGSALEMVKRLAVCA